MTFGRALNDLGAAWRGERGLAYTVWGLGGFGLTLAQILLEAAMHYGMKWGYEAISVLAAGLEIGSAAFIAVAIWRSARNASKWKWTARIFGTFQVLTSIAFSITCITGIDPANWLSDRDDPTLPPL